MSKRTWRNITVNNVHWRWYIGRGGNIVAINDNEEKKTTKAWDIKGMSPDTYDRGQWKKTVDGMITPKDIAIWLREA